MRARQELARRVDMGRRDQAGVVGSGLRKARQERSGASVVLGRIVVPCEVGLRGFVKRRCDWSVRVGLDGLGLS